MTAHTHTFLEVTEINYPKELDLNVVAEIYYQLLTARYSSPRLCLLSLLNYDQIPVIVAGGLNTSLFSTALSDNGSFEPVSHGINYLIPLQRNHLCKLTRYHQNYICKVVELSTDNVVKPLVLQTGLDRF